MAGPPSYNARRPSPGSLLARWLTAQTPHPDSFECGIRVVSGRVAQEGMRWRFRRSAVDPLRTAGIITLNHGPRATLRLKLCPDPIDYGSRGSSRFGFAVLTARELDTGALVQVSVPVGELERFGVDPD